MWTVDNIKQAHEMICSEVSTGDPLLGAFCLTSHSLRVNNRLEMSFDALKPNQQIVLDEGAM